MTDPISSSDVQFVADPRLGGPFNILFVVEKGWEDNLALYCWFVDYDRLRDEGWTLDRAQQQHDHPTVTAGVVDRGPLIARWTTWQLDRALAFAREEYAKRKGP